MNNSTALFNILIADFYSQIISIMIMILLCFIINFGESNSQERLTDKKYLIKLFTIFINLSCTNIYMGYSIIQDGQQELTSIAAYGFFCDIVLLILLILLIIMIIYENVTSGRGAQPMAHYLKWPSFNNIRMLMIIMISSKVFTIFFGCMYLMAFDKVF